MKKQPWIIFFIVILIIHLIGLVLKIQLVEYVSKPMIVVVLALYFLSQTNTNVSGLKKWILAALLFSWAGDVLLMFQVKKEIFFLAGLVCFLLTHIIYGFSFDKIIRTEKIERNTFFFMLSILYVIFLLRFLNSHLRNMKWPVIIYGCVLGAMFSVSLHLVNGKNKIAGYFIAAGALLFVISDSMLAINKFYQPFNWAGVLIMLTYGLAQLFIVEGAIKYITSADKE